MMSGIAKLEADLAAAKARIAELEAERAEAYRALNIVRPAVGFGTIFEMLEVIKPIFEKARAFVEGKRKEARDNG